jgi:hypothetical protein
MNYKISRLEAKNELFIHFTYLWNIQNIQKEGLRQSQDGLMGWGIYCCRADDKMVRDEIVEFLSEEIDWRKVTKNFPGQAHSRALARSLIHLLYIEYTGPYLYGEENKAGFSEVTGFVLIPKYSIKPNHLIIGCPVDSGIEPDLLAGKA